MSVFEVRVPAIASNPLVRTPQREAYAALVGFAAEDRLQDREGGIVLPVGCGKTGCITIAPFAFRSRRTLVVAPGLNITTQLVAAFDPAHRDFFYTKTAVLPGPPYPEPVEIRGRTANRGDLDECEVAITNIGQLQGAENRWLQTLPDNFFDLVLFDEGHHNVAASWRSLREKFPHARIINF